MKWWYLVLFQAVLLFQDISCDSIKEGDWSAWTTWSPCSHHCTQTRSRTCQNLSALSSLSTIIDSVDPCIGDSLQTIECYRADCPQKIKTVFLPKQHPVKKHEEDERNIKNIKKTEANSVKNHERKIIIASVSASVLVLVLLFAFYLWCRRRNSWRPWYYGDNNSNDNGKPLPYSLKTLRKKMTESTRRFVRDGPVRGWLYNIKQDDVDEQSKPKETELGFYDDQGRFIKSRSKSLDGGVLPTIPTNVQQTYQQEPSNPDTTYVNSKFLQHHLVTRKDFERKSNALAETKKQRRPLPELPVTHQVTDNGYEQFVNERKYEEENPYLVAEDQPQQSRRLPKTPVMENPYFAASQPQNSSKLPKTPLENPYLSTDDIKHHRRQLPITPTSKEPQASPQSHGVVENQYVHAEDVRKHRRQLPKTPSKKDDEPSESHSLMGGDTESESYMELADSSPIPSATKTSGTTSMLEPRHQTMQRLLLQKRRYEASKREFQQQHQSAHSYM